jgi:NCAIR mutase (PurE)-related protein
MRTELKHLFEGLAAGALTVEEALERVPSLGLSELGFARLDRQRGERCGVPEVVFAERKTPEQVRDILRDFLQTQGHALATRLTPAALELLRAEWPAAETNDLARTVLLGEPPAPPADQAPVLILAAGTSDLPVAEEAAVTARYTGCRVETLYDVGVAGLHRLFSAAEHLERAGVVIVVAGMEGALPSVVGGLVRAPVVAVPTSVGYGAAFGGVAALLGMLNSCAAGVSVVNIDNGFGAAMVAAKILAAPRCRAGGAPATGGENA